MHLFMKTFLFNLTIIHDISCITLPCFIEVLCTYKYMKFQIKFNLFHCNLTSLHSFIFKTSVCVLELSQGIFLHVFPYQSRKIHTIFTNTWALYSIIISCLFGREDQLYWYITQSDNCSTNFIILKKTLVIFISYFPGLLELRLLGFVFLVVQDCWKQEVESERIVLISTWLIQEDCSWWFYWLESWIERLGCLV